MKDINPLDVVFESEIGQMTVREFIVRLGLQVWLEEEGFSSKRPFGNSGWLRDPLDAIIEAAELDADDVLAVDVSVAEAVYRWLGEIR